MYWEDKGVRWVYWGTVTDQEFIDSTLELCVATQFLELRYQIVDFLEVTHFDVTSETIHKTARMDKEASKRNPDIRVAFLTTSTMVKGLTRMWDLSGGGEHWEAAVFQDEFSARRWLGI